VASKVSVNEDRHCGRPRDRRHSGRLGARIVGPAVAVAILLACLTMASGASAETVCTNTWTGPSEGNWQTAADWSLGNAPTASDVACIGAGDTVDVSEGTNQAGVVQGTGALVLSGGTLELTNALEASSIASLTFSRATLAIAGELDVGSALTAGGPGSTTLSGAGRLVVGPGVTGRIGGNERCSRLVLNGITLLNQGNLTFGTPGGAPDGPISMENGAQVQNAGTFNDDSTEPGGCGFGRQPSFFNNGGGTSSITNTGTFQSDDGEERVEVGVPFENQGTIGPQTGTLQLSGGGTGTTGAHFSAPAGTALELTGGSFTLSGATWSGPGTIATSGASITATSLQSDSAHVSVSGGSLSIPEGSSSTVTALALTGGTLDLAGQLSVSSSISGGRASTIEGSGKLVLGSAAQGTIGGNERCSRLVLNGVTLLNQGNLTLGTAGGAPDGPISMENGAQIQNAGTFNDDSTEPGGCGFGRQPSIFGNGGTTPTITNTGTFQSNDTEEPIVIGVPFNNQGTISPQAGTLQLGEGGTSTSTASFSPATSATLAFTAGSYTLTGGSFSGQGTVSLQGANITASALQSTSADVSMSSGSLSIPEGSTDTVSSGLLAFNGNAATVDGPGRLVVGASATGAIDAGRCSRVVFNGVMLLNQGTVTTGTAGGAPDGPISMENGAQIQNAGTFNDDSTEPGGCGFGRQPSIFGNGGTTPSIVNTGTFQSNDTEEPIVIGVPFNNQGTISPQAGTLQLGEGGTSTGGTFAATTGTALEFTGGSFALSGATWSGAGAFAVTSASVTAESLQSTSAHVSVSGGSLSIPTGSTSNVTALAVTGGTLDLAGQLNVSSSLSGEGRASTIEGSGKLVLGSAAQGTINGERCSRLVLNGVTLLNQGNLTFGTPGGAPDGPISMENGAQIQNAGTFNDDSTEPGGCGFGRQPSIFGNGGTTPSIVNTGTFQSNDTEEPIVIGVPFNNQGTISPQAGTLQLGEGGTSTGGTFAATTGTALEFTGGSFALSGATWSGAGAFAVTSASVTAESLQSTSAHVSVSGGSLSIPTGSTSNVTALAVTGGTLDLAGQLNVSSSLSGEGRASTIEGSGKLVLGSAAQGTINGERCSRLVLNGVTLLNQGNLTFGTPGGAPDGPISMENGAQIQNAGTFNDDSTEPGGCGFGRQPSIFGNGGTTPTITNTGTFQSNDTEEPIVIGVPFNNQGTISPQAGTLQLGEGGTSTSTASFSPATSATLEFTGGSYALIGGTWSGAGTTVLAGASVTASGLHASGHTSLNGGVLTVPQGAEVAMSGTLAVGGNFTLAGPGTFAAEPGTTAATDIGCARLLLENVTYLNKGTFTLAPGSAALWMQDGAQLQNDGAFIDQSEDSGCGFGSGGSSIYNGGGGESTILDAGTFRAESAGNTLVVAVPFNDQGTVEAKGGTLQLDGNLTNNKLISIAAGARLNVTGNYVEGENGTLKIGVESPSSFGSLSVDGTSGLDGLLEVASAGGYTSELGQTFAVVSSAAESGAFSFVGGSGLPSGASYQPNYSNTGVTLVVANAEGQVPVPVLVTPPRITAGSLQQGQTLVLTHATWEHVPSEYVDQWLRCSEAGGECLPIPGAGGQEYVTSRSDVGHTIVVQEIARNAGGESKPADSSPTAVVTALPLRAVAGETVSTFTGAKVTLDGAASTPSAEISSYRWEFGDGESAEGAVVHHVYRSPGTYTATLTINRGSEHSSQSLTVDVVTPPGAEHAAAIMLSDSSEHPISEATVLYVGANGTRYEETTNSRGEADLAGLPEGEDTVYVYKSGFRPATGVVDVNDEHQGVASITLEPGEVATTGLSSHELTFSEIVEAGIDPNEAANQTVDSFEAKLEFAGSITVELQGNINSEGEFAGNAPTGNVKPPEGGGSPSPLKCEQQGANPEHTGCETTVENSSGETTRIIAKPTTIETHPVIQWLILRGSAVTVKQFFEMSMVVQNLSPEEPFGLTAGTATLNLPSGMSLAPTAEPQSLSQSVAAIPPLEGATTTWIIRGDAPGEYTPSVDYEAELEPFGTTVSTQAALAQPLEVWGANALSTVLKIDSGQAEPGIPYHIALGVKNVSNIPLYNVAVNTSAPVHNHFILQPDQQFATTVGELRPGQTVFAPQYILVTQSPHEIYGEIKEGKLIGESDAELKSVTLAGETSNATPTIERISPPPLYEATPSAAGGGEIHLQWQQVPGAEGYEVFSTPSLGTPFGASPLAVLPATASSTNVSGSNSEFFAVSTLIGGRPILDHPLVEASRAGQEEEEKEREKQEEEELERERHKQEEEAKKEKHEGEENESEPNHRHCKSGDAVNCATGNHTETQTDLEVGGRGPVLSLTRTYNSQQAARQSKPGPFGYGWTGPRGAYATVSRWCSVKRTCARSFSGSVVIHQADGATVYFSKQEEGGPGKEGWTAGPLVQSSLTEAGNQLIMRLPDGHTLTFNTSGHLSTHLGPAKFFSITEGSAPISSETDRDGNAMSFSYNEAGQLTAIADASGRRISLSYNSEGLVTSATDPMAHTVKYGYEHGNLISETEPGETTPRWKFTYDSAHQMTSETEGGNHTETTEYDAEHRVIAQTDAAGRKRAWKYTTTSSGPQTTITEPNGSTTIEQFNSEDSPTSITRAAGTPLAVTTFSEYNGQGELVASTDPAGGETTYTYDAEGNRTSERDPLGDTTKWTYNAGHEVTSETKPNGETTTITRDEHGNETEVSRPAPGGQTQTTKHTYDSAGELTSTTDPLGRKWTYAYDANGDRESETDPEGNKRTFSYDADSNEISSVSPLGNVAGANAAKFKATIDRDARERMIETIDPLGHTTKTTYNSNGQIATVTEADGHTTTYAYDADNEPTKATEADGATKETEYDAAGQVIAHIDGDHHKTTYVRNALEQVTEVIDPLGHRTTKTYDANGNLAHETNPEGKTTTYTYDADNRQTKVAYSDGKTASVEYEYNADGDRTKMIDASGTTTYAYDTLDRLTESIDGHGERTAYEYDLDSEPTKVTYPNGKAVTHTFDSDGRLKTTTDWLGNTTTFSYNADSDQTATTFPHASEDLDEFTYNDADELTKTVMKKGKKTLASLAYTRAKNGQVTKTTSKGLPGEAKTSLTYDTANRLTKAGTVAYEYDAAGNPTKIGTTTDTFNAGDELTSTSAGTTYSYNEEGERIKATPASGPATTYAYDQAGNQIAVSRPGEGAIQPIEETYTYNGDGLRVSQSGSGHTSYLSWDTAEQLSLLLSDGSNSYIYGPGGLPIEQISSEGRVLYLHHDQRGSTRLLTGSTGAVEGTFTYGGYGEQTGSTGTATTPLGYAGQYTEANTGLIYLRARSYEPATAQFTSVDPDVGSTWSPYGYAKDDPVDAGDPSGLASAAEIKAETVQEALAESDEAERRLYAERLEAEKACDQELAAQKGREEQQVKDLRYAQVHLLETLDRVIDAEERRRIIIEWYKGITEYFAKTYACELPLFFVGGPESRLLKLATGTAAGVAGSICAQWASPDETDG
jgi:RHS repeat-associated protein